jgi:hypothetical protein
MTDLVDARPAVPHQRVRAGDPVDVHRLQPAEPPSLHPGGVELGRLLARAQLTVPQGIELAAAVSAEAVRRPEPAPGSADGPVLVGPVVIGADGRVVADPPAHGGGTGGAPAGPPAGAALAKVLGDVADAVRPRARHAGPAAERLVNELDGAVADLPLAGAPATARRLRDLAGGIHRGTVRSELGALVRAIGGAAGPPGGRPAGSTAAAARSPRRRPAAARRGTRKRWIGAWLVSLLVLAGVVAGEVGLLRDHIAADVEALLDAGRGSATPSPTPAARPVPAPAARPVPTPGPAAAGDVTAVDLRAVSPCVPGSPCTVRLQVRLAASADAGVVRWSFRLVDRCSGATLLAPGGSVAVPADAPRVQAVGVVALPAALPAVAVSAVTDAPAVAASPPLLVGVCPASPVTR